MVELSAGAAAVAAAGAAALVLVAVVVVVRARRHTAGVNRRLSTVAARLEEPGARTRQERDSVARLEQLAESSVLRRVETEAAQERLAGALRAQGHGVVVCDDTGEVVFRNEAAAMVDDGTVQEVLRAALAGEQGDREVELPGTPSRRARLSGQPLDDGTRPLGAVVVIEDRSEVRRADALRQDLLANLTAELRAPMAALNLLAGTIASDLSAGMHPQAAARLAERLADEAGRAGRVVEDVVELSQLDAGVPPAAGPVSVHLLVAEAVDGAQPAAGAADVPVKATEPSPALTVVGARRHLVSAVRHLVENAVRHSPPGGTVTVQVGAEDGWVLVAVADEGPGIPAHELDLVFESFYRGGATSPPGAGGSGLGLAIAARVAAAHGGEVLVGSAPGTGSVFTLKLPAGP